MRRILALTAALAASTSAVRAESVTQVWSLIGAEEKKPERIFLSYGTPQTDDQTVSFNCKPGGGEATVFIAETSVKLRPGKRATATLSAGRTTVEIAGKIMPNEMSGVPSFEGRVRADSALFEAMASAPTLAIGVGLSKQTAPLAGAADTIRRFAAKCAKR